MKKLLEMGLSEEKIIKIISDYQRRIERAKQYQKEKYFKVSIAVKKKDVQKVMENMQVDEKVAKKIVALQKLQQELAEYIGTRD